MLGAACWGPPRGAAAAATVRARGLAMHGMAWPHVRGQRRTGGAPIAPISGTARPGGGKCASPQRHVRRRMWDLSSRRRHTVYESGNTGGDGGASPTAASTRAVAPSTRVCPFGRATLAADAHPASSSAQQRVRNRAIGWQVCDASTASRIQPILFFCAHPPARSSEGHCLAREPPRRPCTHEAPRPPRPRARRVRRASVWPTSAPPLPAAAAGPTRTRQRPQVGVLLAAAGGAFDLGDLALGFPLLLWRGQGLQRPCWRHCLTGTLPHRQSQHYRGRRARRAPSGSSFDSSSKRTGSPSSFEVLMLRDSGAPVGPHTGPQTWPSRRRTLPVLRPFHRTCMIAPATTKTATNTALPVQRFGT